MKKNVVNDLLAAAGLAPREVFPEGVKVRFLIIGPAEAQALLVSNVGNRNVRQHRVSYYARQIAAGKWMLSHQGLAFSTDGVGIDLQHRLLGVIEAGKEAVFMVTEGLSPEAFNVIDDAERRSTADRLHADKYDVEVANFFLKMGLTTNNTTPIPAQVARMLDATKGPHQALVTFCNSRARVLSSVAVRCAAVLVCMRPRVTPLQVAQVHSTYRAMILRDYDALNQTAKALLKQIDSKQKARSENGNDLFARAYRVFDYRKPDVGKIQVDPELIEQAREEVRTTLAESLA